MAVRLENTDMVILVEVLDTFLHGLLKAEDRARASALRRSMGHLIGTTTHYEVVPAKPADAPTGQIA